MWRSASALIDLRDYGCTLQHTHTRLMALCLGQPRWAGTRKVKPIRILLKQETVSGSGISWATWKSAPRSRQITMPAPHHSVFTGRMPFLLPNQQRQSTEGCTLQQGVKCVVDKRKSKWLLLKGMFLCARIVSHNCWWNADNGGDFNLQLCTYNTITYSTRSVMMRQKAHY